MKNKYLYFISLFCICLFSFTFAESATQDNHLFTLDSKKLGSENMNILIKEVQFSNNISTIDEKVFTRGSAAGSSMFGMCAFTIFAKKRGYSHFVILEHSSNTECNDCEWTSVSSIGYLTDVNPAFEDSPENFHNEDRNRKIKIREYLSTQFPSHKFSDNGKDLEILPVKGFMLICERLESICSW